VIKGKEIDCKKALRKSQLPRPEKHRSEEEVAVGMAQGIMMMDLKVGIAAAVWGGVGSWYGKGDYGDGFQDTRMAAAVEY
jgi:hypothetical protein